jgi:hypothetical protein
MAWASAAGRAPRIEHIPAEEQRTGAGQPMAPGFVILVVDGPNGAQRFIGPPAPALAAPPLGARLVGALA